MRKNMSINFKDALKYFKGTAQEKKALNYLQSKLPEDVLVEFERLWKEKPPAPPADAVPESGLKLIKEFEGCHLSAYPDPLTGGLPITIGWGSTRRADGSHFQMGDTLTQEEADNLLIEQCKNEFLPALQKIPHWGEMSDGQRGALLSFAYNLGAGFYSGSNFNTITKCLKNKEWDKVPDALYLYRNPGTNVEAGLARRRKVEGKLWIS